MTTQTNSYRQAEKAAIEWVETAAHTQTDSVAFPKRGAGSPSSFLKHGHAVAAILQEWGAGDELQIAGLYHSLLWNCAISAEEVAQHCGTQVLHLCNEYQRILVEMPENRWRGKPHILDQVKHFILAYRSHDLALLGAADLWAHYQSAKEGTAAYYSRHARIARLVLLPYLQFLGMWELSDILLADLDASAQENRGVASSTIHADESVVKKGFRFQPADPESVAAYAQIKKLVKSCLPNAEIILRRTCQNAETKIGNGSKSIPFRSQPVLYLCLIVESDAHCYEALYQLHQRFTPIDGAIADLISGGRRDGYRCLQTKVIHELDDRSKKDRLGKDGLNSERTDVDERIRVRLHFEICTAQMDRINRWGLVAAHLGEGDGGNAPNAWWNDTENHFESISSAPLGSLNETLYVFSPQGALFGFHRGCTVVDYAYSIHSELAAQCRRFYVNGEAVEPATALHHLDLVELEHDPGAPGPNRVWLNAARTPRARTHIDRYLKRHGEGIYHAQQLLDKRLKALENHYGFNMPERRVNQAISREMKRRHINAIENLMAEISSGGISVDRILHPLFADEIIRQVEIPSDTRLRPHQLVLAQCCRPKPGDDIVGKPYQRSKIITKLTIHRLDCKKRGNQPDKDLSLRWRLQPELEVVSQIEMRALDEKGLIGDAISQIDAIVPPVTLHRSETAARNGVATARFVIEASSSDLIDEIVDGLRRLPNRTVDEVRQVNLPLSEREELIKPVSTSQANPYSRMPVYEEGMFFGRSKELSEIREWLRTRLGIIWLLGQKRVGKTSLLLYLQNHFLDSTEFTPIYLDFQMLSTLQPTDIFFEIANSVYSELQSEGHGAELGPPLRTMFEHDPIGQVIRYLRGAQSHPGVGKLVLLLDEFSRTTDAHQQGKLDASFFTQWRGLVQMTQPNVKFVIVVQQQAFDSMMERVQGGEEDPSWRLMELGEKRTLLPLTEKDARNLIEWPIRNYLELSDELLERITYLTGGSPFLIQSFCFKLVSHMIVLNKREVGWADLDQVRMDFMSPNESVFAHLLDLIRGVANSVSIQIARVADWEMQQDHQAIPVLSWQQIVAANPELSAEQLRSTVDELCERHILTWEGGAEDILEGAPEDVPQWRFSSLLFQEWLAINSEGY